MTDTNNDDKRAEFEEALKGTLTEAVRAGLTSVDEAQNTMNERMAQLEARLDAAPEPTHSLPGASSSQDGEEYSLGRVFRALGKGAHNFEKEAPMEWAMSEEIRDMGTTPDTAGGFLVPTQVFDQEIIPLLRPRVIAMELGVQELQATGSPVEIPSEKTGPAVDAVAENAANTATDLSFGSLIATPHTAQSYIKASRRFLSMGAGAESFIRNRMAEEIALTMNKWILKGTGAAGEPTGILNTTGLAVNGAGGAATWVDTLKALTTAYTDLLHMEEALADSNALEGAGALGWAMHPRAKRALRQIATDNAGVDVNMAPRVFSAGAETQILGHNYRTSTQLDAGSDGLTGEVLFGNWEKAMLVQWGNLSVEASNTADDAMSKRQTHIVAYCDMDVIVTQPSAFTAITDLDLSGI
jgi:HK97 family phage major capsid protein